MRLLVPGGIKVDPHYTDYADCVWVAILWHLPQYEYGIGANTRVGDTVWAKYT